MSRFGEYRDLNVELLDDYVAVAEIQRPPNNFFDEVLINSIGDAFEALDADDRCRAIVLAAAGKNFCAGADFSGGPREGSSNTNAGELYRQAVRLFRTRKPVIGAIQGAAIGGGLGLALVPDFRVACEESRFSANFSRLGFHPGFGLTVTLPAKIQDRLRYPPERIEEIRRLAAEHTDWERYCSQRLVLRTPALPGRVRQLRRP